MSFLALHISWQLALPVAPGDDGVCSGLWVAFSIWHMKQWSCSPCALSMSDLYEGNVLVSSLVGASPLGGTNISYLLNSKSDLMQCGCTKFNFLLKLLASNRWHH